jgi:dihydropteroate synthase
MKLKSSENTRLTYRAGDKLITFNKPLVMGIINLTPDSFYDGGRYSGIRAVIQDAEEKIRLGADILDLGAASSRPGAKEISTNEEWQRLEEALIELRKRFPDAIISVDTCHSEIARKAKLLGADIINDISGGQADDKMFETVAELQLPYVLMHMQGNPQNMQEHPSYKDVVQEILAFFKKAIKKLNELGFNQVILDPGFGFGKNLEHNYKLLKHFSDFNELGYPLLAGLSRKSMINKVIGTNPVTSLNGTTVLNTIALLNGASVLRVHDVQEARQAVELTTYYQNS